MRQYRLSAGSLGAATRRAVELYGPGARIVSAERVLDAGLRGLLGRRHVEATVVVPDLAEEGAPSFASIAPHALPAALARRAGIAALLHDADRDEAALHAESVSTQGEGFDSLLDRLRGEVAEDDDAVPSLLGEPGDLVLVIGLGTTALDVARAIARDPNRWQLAAVGEPPAGWPTLSAGEPPAGWPTLSAGEPPADWPALAGSRQAVAARARAVEAGAAVLAVCSLQPLDPIEPQLGTAASIRADQVWLAVDARHKADETAEWVDAVVSLLPVDALAVVGASKTRTAYTVNGLGIPVGWVDGFPAPRTVL